MKRVASTSKETAFALTQVFQDLWKLLRLPTARIPPFPMTSLRSPCFHLPSRITARFESLIARAFYFIRTASPPLSSSPLSIPWVRLTSLALAFSYSKKIRNLFDLKLTFTVQERPLFRAYPARFSFAFCPLWSLGLRLSFLYYSIRDSFQLDS